MKLDESGEKSSRNYLVESPENQFLLPLEDYGRLEATLIVPGSTSGLMRLTTEFFEDEETTPSVPKVHTPCSNIPPPSIAVGDKLSEFALSYACVFDPTASLHNQQATPDGNAVRFLVCGVQWCSNVERGHKSNRVYYLVNFLDNILSQRNIDFIIIFFCWCHQLG